MAEKSGIEWTDSTWNPWIGCTRVSPGCDHCYAAVSTPARAMGIAWGPGEHRHRTAALNWRAPLVWERHHGLFFAKHGRRQRVFCASLADVFDNEIPQAWRDDVFSLIEATPHLDWLVLTKRIGNVQHMVWPRWMQLGFPGHLWLGATVVDQEEFDRDANKLLALPAALRFLSVEPMLGPIDATPSLGAFDWVIAGGESGPSARPMRFSWVDSLHDQCAWFNVPFFFKQWGEWLGELQDGDPKHSPIAINASDAPIRVGKRAAGRLLDRKLHDAFPQSRAGTSA